MTYEQIYKDSLEYLNENVKPLFIPIIARAIKDNPNNGFKFLLEELSNLKGESLNRNSEREELKNLRKIKQILKEQILLRELNDYKEDEKDSGED